MWTSLKILLEGFRQYQQAILPFVRTKTKYSNFTADANKSLHAKGQTILSTDNNNTSREFRRSP